MACRVHIYGGRKDFVSRFDHCGVSECNVFGCACDNGCKKPKLKTLI